MPLIIDTFNVLHTVGVLPPDLAGLDVPGLAALILRSRYAAVKVTFACDGLPAADLPPQGPLELPSSPDHASTMNMRYSGQASTADDLIRQVIDSSTAPRRLIVVSSDHAIQKHANRRRCVVLTSQEFLQHLADDANLPRTAPSGNVRRPSGMSAEQVEQWKHVFRIDDEVAAALAIQQSTSPPTPSSPALNDRVASPTLDHPLDDDRTSKAGPTQAGTPVLPDDLISEAEAILQRESRPPPARPGSSPPPVSSQPAIRAQTDAPQLPTIPPSIDGDVDLANIDMDAILPQDGRTRRLGMDDHRRRPK